jgi:hypothetical protein
MVEFRACYPSVTPIGIRSYSGSMRNVFTVCSELAERWPLKYEHIGTSRNINQSGDDFVRVSAINEQLKSSYGYYWCIGVVGFGSNNGQENSFLSHGQDNVEKQKDHIKNAVKRLLDLCDINTCDFAVLGGQNNLPDASAAMGTLRYSAEVQKEIIQIIIEETQGKIRPVVIPPSHLDNHLTDLDGKHVLIETPRRVVHVFETLFPMENMRIDDTYITPGKRAYRHT